MRLISNYRSAKPYMRLFFEHGVIIFIGVIIFLVDEEELLHYLYPKSFLVAWATAKAVFFLFDTIRRLIAFLRQRFDYFSFTKFAGVSVMLIVFSFAVDYWCLFRVEAVSFAGVPEAMPLHLQLFDFTYFSLCTFSTVGFGDIYPQTITAKYVVMLEMTLSFITIILVISNFSHFRRPAEE